MNNRELKSLIKRYEERIEFELSNGIIKVNKDGKIKKSILLSRDIVDGSSRRIQAEGRTVKDCAEKLAKLHMQKLNYIDDFTKSRTFGEVAEEWYDVEIKNASISSGNKKNYRTDLDLHIIPKLKKLDISQLKKKDYQLFLNSFAGKGESMVKKIRMTLMRIIKYAIENEYMPDRMITLSLPETISIKKREILTTDQIKLLVKAQIEYKPAFVFIVMVSTGMRPCELYEMKYSDIDFDKKIIYINKSKTENGIRIVPISDYPLNLILNDRNELQANGFEPIYVFHQQLNPLKPHNAGTLIKTWHTTLRVMDIINGAVIFRNEIIESSLNNKDNLDAYNLRHTYCTMLNNCGIGEYFKKRLMGHTLKDSITDSVYTHSTEEEIIKASAPFINYIDDLFKDSLN